MACLAEGVPGATSTVWECGGADERAVTLGDSEGRGEGVDGGAVAVCVCVSVCVCICVCVCLCV